MPLHSTLVLKKRRRLLYIPLEFGELTIDGLVDSGAFITAKSWSSYSTIKMNIDSCVIKEFLDIFSNFKAQMPNWNDQ